MSTMLGQAVVVFFSFTVAGLCAVLCIELFDATTNEFTELAVVVFFSFSVAGLCAVLCIELFGATTNEFAALVAVAFLGAVAVYCCS